MLGRFMQLGRRMRALGAAAAVLLVAGALLAPAVYGAQRDGGAYESTGLTARDVAPEGSAAPAAAFPQMVTAQSSSGDMWMVATDGDDATCAPAPSTNKCRTVQHAVSVASPGDIVEVEQGTYVESVVITDTRITIRGQDGWLPFITGERGFTITNMAGDPLITRTKATKAIVAGDIDLDGDEDLVVADPEGPRRYFNEGQAVFTDDMRSEIPDADGVQALAIGDVDADGTLDLVAGTDTTPGPSRLYLGKGDGDFAPGLAIPGTDGQDTRAVVLVDLNDDGYLDLIAGNDGAANQVLLGGVDNAGFGFTELDPFGSASGNTTSLAVGDVNGDGRLDVVAGHDGGEANELFLGLGGGQLAGGETLPGPTDATNAVVLADFNGDSQLDLAVGNEGAASLFYANTGVRSAPFDTSSVLVDSATEDAFGLAAVDLEGDGDIDIVAANGGASLGMSAVYLNDGSTDPFAGVTPVDISEDRRSSAVVVTDLDGDGDPDIATANDGEENRVYRNDSWQVARGRPITLRSPELTFSDDPFSGQSPITTAWAYADRVENTWTSIVNNRYMVEFANFDCDDACQESTDPEDVARQAPDLITGGRAYGKQGLAYNNINYTMEVYTGSYVAGRLVFNAVQALNTSNENAVEALAVGDANSDGLDDVVLNDTPDSSTPKFPLYFAKDPVTNGGNIFDIGDGATPSADIERLPDIPVAERGPGYYLSRAHSVELVDLNSDGHLDLLVGNEWVNYIVFNDEDGSGAFDRRSIRRVGAGSDLTTPRYSLGLAVGDVDADGTLDIVEANRNDDDMHVYLGVGGGSFGKGQAIPGTAAASNNIGTSRPKLADLNGDGYDDLVAIFGRRLHEEGSIGKGAAVLINGEGEFGPPTFLASDEEWVSDIRVSDMNNDLIPDILTIGPAGGFLYVGNGDGTFGSGQGVPVETASPQPQSPFPVLRESRGRGVATHDLNGDGWQDVIVTNAVYRGDKWPDDVATTITHPILSYALNNAGGGPLTIFDAAEAEGQSFDSVTRVSSLVAGDVTGDGWDDALLISPFDSEDLVAGRLQLLEGDGQGGFSDGVEILGAGGLHDGGSDIALGDVDRDGDLDLFVAGAGGLQGDRLLFNDGSGQFGEPIEVSPTRGSYAAQLSDLNGDGWLDVVGGAAGPTTKNVIYINGGDGSLGSPVVLDGNPRRTLAVAVGDVDGDADEDIVAGNYGQSNQVYFNEGNGEFAAGVDLQPSTFITDGMEVDLNSTLDIALADINGDGSLDVVELTENGVGIGLNDGSGPLTAFSPVSVTIEPVYHLRQDYGGAQRAVLDVGDLDGDGDLDIVVEGLSAAGLAVDIVVNSLGPANTKGIRQVLINQGAGAYTTALRVPLPFVPVAGVMSDVDGDGDLDLLRANAGGLEKRYVLGQVLPSFAPSSMVRNEVRSTPFLGSLDRAISHANDDTAAVAVADINGDGWSDLVLGNGGNAISGQLNRLLLGSERGLAGAATTGVAIGGERDNTAAIHLGDLNGDGRPDLVVGNRGQSNRVYLNDGGPSPFEGVAGQPIARDEERTAALAVGDLDGDGDDDLVVANDGDPNRVYLNTAGSFDGRSGQGTGDPLDSESAPSRAVALIDANDDGRRDILVGDGCPEGVARGAACGAVRFYENVGGGSFSSARSLALPSTVFDVRALAVSDVDADGDSDFVAGLRRGGTWLFLNAGNGIFDPAVQIPGVVDARAVALSDLTGDGYPDLVSGSASGRRVLVVNQRGDAHAFASGSIVFGQAEGGVTSLAIGDVDGDRDIDIVAGRSPVGLAEAGTVHSLIILNRLGSAVRLSGLGLAGGYASNGGGVSVPFGRVDALDVVIARNRAEGQGGGVFVGVGAESRLDGRLVHNVAGHDGGGAFVARRGSLELREALLTGNRAPRGGAIHAAGSLHSEDAEVAENWAIRGGGLLLASASSVQRSLVRHNRAERYGGGLLLARDGELDMRASTVSGNLARVEGGGLYAEAGAAGGDIAFSTIYGNAVDFNLPPDISRQKSSANLHVSGGSAPSLRGVLLGAARLAHGPIGLTDPASGAPVSCGGVMPELSGFNRISDASCKDEGSTAQGTDRHAVPLSVGPLADNGGPTATHAVSRTAVIDSVVAPNTILLDVVPASECGANARDQRGRRRPLVGLRNQDLIGLAEERAPQALCDVGAYELGATQLLVCGPPLGLFTHPSRCDYESVTAAMAVARDEDHIVVSGVVTDQVTVDRDVLITGPPIEDVTPGTHMGFVQRSPEAPMSSSDPNGAVFEVASGISATIRSLNIRHGDGTDGGGIRNQGDLHLDRVTLYHNNADYGGAVHNTGRLTVTNSTLSGNVALEAGGGIFNAGDADSSILHGTFVDNYQGGNAAPSVGSDGDTRSAVIGDFDLDGNLDLVLADHKAPVFLYLGRGNGTFENAGQIGASSIEASALVADDLNGDGRLDLIVANWQERSLVFRQIDEGPTCPKPCFANPAPIGSGSGRASYRHRSKSMALADLDGDSDLDLVVGDSGGNTRTYLGNGDATFQNGAGGSIPPTEAIVLVQRAGGGNYDLLVGSIDGSAITRHEWIYNAGLGLGFFQWPGDPIGSAAPVADSARALAVGDVDGDGNDDLVAGHDGRNFWYKGDGAGGFDPPRGMGSPVDDAERTRAILLADVDGVNGLDVVAGNEGANKLYLNDGSGSFFQAEPIDRDGLTTYQLLIGDVTGDLLDDLFAANDGPNQLLIHNGTDAPYSGGAGQPSQIHNDAMAESVVITNTMLSVSVRSLSSKQCSGDVTSGGGNLEHNGDCFQVVTSPFLLASPMETAGWLGRGIQRLAQALRLGRDAAPSGVSSVQATGEWIAVDDLDDARFDHTAILLSDEVVVTGGEGPTTRWAETEVYSPTLDAWAATGSMSDVRSLHTGLLIDLNQGRSLPPSLQILAAGGVDASGNALRSSELYSPTTGAWTDQGDMSVARREHTASVLPSGNVLAIGGSDGTAALDTIELYSLLFGVWVTSSAQGPFGDMSEARLLHTAVQVPNVDQDRSESVFRDLLVIGGEDELGTKLDSVEQITEALQTWLTREPLPVARSRHTATVLTGTLRGNVLVVGGEDSGSNALNDVRMYDPYASGGSGEWTTMPTMPGGPRKDHTATLLDDGRVLVAGGRGAFDVVLNTAEVFDPVTETWTDVGPMTAYRTRHTATKLLDGRVLVVGGRDVGVSGDAQLSAEVFDPSAERGSESDVTGDPFVARLRDNGGPTLTHAVGEDSATRDAGIAGPDGDCMLPIGQRGNERPHDDACDIGAIEYGPDVLRVCQDCEDAPELNRYDTVQEAVVAAMAADTIEIEAGRYTEPVVVYKDMTLRHAGVPVSSLSNSQANDVRAVIQSSALSVFEQSVLLEARPGRQPSGTSLSVHAFEYPAGLDVPPVVEGGDVAATIRGLTIRQGMAREGGGIRNLGRLAVYTSTIAHNAAVDLVGGAGTSLPEEERARGGGIANRGVLTLWRSTVSDNLSEFSGGGISNVAVASTLRIPGGVPEANLEVSQSTIAGNTADRLGDTVTLVVDNGDDQDGVPQFLDPQTSIVSGDRVLVQNRLPFDLSFNVDGLGCIPSVLEVGANAVSAPLVCRIRDTDQTVTLSSADAEQSLLQATLSVSRVPNLPDTEVAHAIHVRGGGTVALGQSVLSTDAPGQLCSSAGTGSLIDSGGYNVFASNEADFENGELTFSTDDSCNPNTTSDKQRTGNGPITPATLRLGPLQDNNEVDVARDRITGYTHTRALLPGSPAIDLIDDPTACATEDHVLEVSRDVGGGIQVDADLVLDAGETVAWSSTVTSELTVVINEGEVDMQLIELPPAEESTPVASSQTRRVSLPAEGEPGDELEYRYSIYEPLAAYQPTVGTTETVTPTLATGTITVVAREREVDQRGQIVPARGALEEFHCDAGAYEFAPWVVGEPLPRPPSAILQAPVWSVGDAENSAEQADYHLWSEADGLDIATRATFDTIEDVVGEDVTAEVAWSTSADFAAQEYVRHVGYVEWPDAPQLHVSGAPVRLSPSGLSGTDFNPVSALAYVDFTPLDPDASPLDQGALEFLREAPAQVDGTLYSVINYSRQTQSGFAARASVVRTVPATEPGVRDVRPSAAPANCTIGQPLDYAATIGDGNVTLRPGHADPEGLAGYVLAGLGFDGVLEESDLVTATNTVDGLIEPLHVRATRAGPIVPMTATAPTLPYVDGSDPMAPTVVVDQDGRETPAHGPIDEGHDLTVAWYRPDASDVAWPVTSVGYRCDWPEAAGGIVIASELGSEINGQARLSPDRFVNPTVYHQPDPARPGFNPNDEHALISASTIGNAEPVLYALRDDLGGRPDAPGVGGRPDPVEDEYAILKYQDGLDDNRVKYALYEVDLTQAASPPVDFDRIAGEVTIRPGGAVVAGSPAEVYGPSAQAAGIATVRVGGSSVTEGGRFSVPVEVLGATNLRTATIWLEYDPTVLTAVQCSPNREDFVERLHGLGLNVGATEQPLDSTRFIALLESGTDATYRWDFDVEDVDGDQRPRTDGPRVSTVYDVTPAEVPVTYTVRVEATNALNRDNPLVAEHTVTVTDSVSRTYPAEALTRAPGCRIVDGSGSNKAVVIDVQSRGRHGVTGDFIVSDIIFTADEDAAPSTAIVTDLTFNQSNTFYQTPAYEDFSFDVTAGNPIFAPAPVRELLDAEACEFTRPFDTQQEPFWKDVKGALWTRAAGSMEVLYYYPMQPGFYLDEDVVNALNTAATTEFEASDPDKLERFRLPAPDPTDPDAQNGKCIPWLHLGDPQLPQLGGDGVVADDGLDGTFVLPVAYNSRWPSLPPLLSVGETVYERAKSGISGVATQLAVTRIFDDIAPGFWDDAGQRIAVSGSEVSESLTQLIDPLAEVRVPLDLRRGDPNQNFTLPAELRTERLLFGGGLSIAGDVDFKQTLPFSLRSRVVFDDLSGELVFKGYYDGTSKEYIKGDPLLLLNVMTTRARDELKVLCGSDPTPGTDCALYHEAVEALYHKSRNPRELDLCRTAEKGIWPNGEAPENPDDFLVGDEDVGFENRCFDPADGALLDAWRDGVPDKDLLVGAQDESGRFGRPDGIPEPFEGLGKGKALTAGNAKGTGFVTVAYNNDLSLDALPVSLQVIKVGCTQNDLGEDSTYRGNLLAIKSDNLFDEKLTIRHTGDFGAMPENFQFEWFIAPVDETAVSPAARPPSYPWKKWTRDGPNPSEEIVIEGANPTTLRDNWLVMRYKGYPACGNQYRYSAFAGDPSAKPSEVRAQLAEGWIKRVVGALNPFDARVTSFETTETDTTVDMVRQAGRRYEGPIALTNDPEVLNQVGLIEAYETVLRRGRQLSIDSNINDQGANAALANVTTRIAKLYGLIGNDAHADALDPTLGLGTDTSVGNAASSLFAFMNQFRADEFGLIDEELALLRGRDETLGGVAAAPTYNRLTWNFSNGDGEVAYQQNYAINDVNGDGFIDEADAATWYPQGHGDAWGHHLTAAKKYYELFRHPSYDWSPRGEPVSVAGAPLVVDYYDEQRFIRAATDRAGIGAEILDLTHRKHYAEPESAPRVDAHIDPADRCDATFDELFAGEEPYPDDARDCRERGWGVDDWARRAGQGAYFDWVTGNAVIPPEDLRWSDVRKIDRTTVAGLAGLADRYGDVERQLDQLDSGQNPLGVDEDAVVFDVDPRFLEIGSGIEGITPFEQTYGRTLVALDAAVVSFNNANRFKIAQRESQAENRDFVREVIDEDIAVVNELITLFGYPYDADIGVNGTYPEGYDGPDIFNYDLFDRTELTDFRERCTRAEIEADQRGDRRADGSRFCELKTETKLVRFEVPSCLEDGVTPLFDERDYRRIDQLILDDVDRDKLCTGNLNQVEIPYRVGSGLDAGRGRFKPDTWPSDTGRRAPGSIGDAIQSLHQARIEYESAIVAYKNHVAGMESALGAIRDRKRTLDAITAGRVLNNVLLDALDAALVLQKVLASNLDVWLETVDFASDKVVGECVPNIVGFSNKVPSGCPIVSGVTGSRITALQSKAGLESTQGATEAAKEVVERAWETVIDELESNYELRQMGREYQDLVRQEHELRLALFLAEDQYLFAQGDYDTQLHTGFRLLRDLIRWRKRLAGQVSSQRYDDMAYRVFQNEALSKYRSQFDLAQRYTYFTAKSYDYATNLAVDDPQTGAQFARSIVAHRSIGEVIPGDEGLADNGLGTSTVPVAGSNGLADPLAKMWQNFAVIKTQYGFNNPQFEDNSFRLRGELFRLNDASDVKWRQTLQRYYTPNIFADRRVAELAQRPFGFTGSEPGLVIPFGTTITYGRNFFGLPLGPGDRAYDPTQFVTHIGLGGINVGFEGYDVGRLAQNPRVYLLPAGYDVTRPRGTRGRLRYWDIAEQILPMPHVIGEADLEDPRWIPMHDGLDGPLNRVKQFPMMRAHALDEDGEPIVDGDTPVSTRLAARSVWNTDWVLVIPGTTMHADGREGIERFIQDVDDIWLNVNTYSYTGR